MKLQVFCIFCGKDTAQELLLRNGEITTTCDCGHALKFPAVAPADLKMHLARHKKQNEGRVILTAAQIEAQDNQTANEKAYLESLVKSGVAK